MMYLYNFFRVLEPLPEKQGLKQKLIPSYVGSSVCIRATSRKTRIETIDKDVAELYETGIRATSRKTRIETYQFFVNA